MKRFSTAGVVPGLRCSVTYGFQCKVCQPVIEFFVAGRSAFLATAILKAAILKAAILKAAIAKAADTAL
ncbi:hypothetical protein [Thalassoglobus polymorphus]|uniref:hypothetical protein n=1 Tax=Thalassoglobus polymorphus TaxID=2527994 RepID=UPI0011A2A0BC|nr:hypothetical protein [Thalassoglobus polymorphus]